MVAFRITRLRLEAWIYIRALEILFYEHYEKKDYSFLVDWYDEPNEWLDQGNKYICIWLLKETIDIQSYICLFDTSTRFSTQPVRCNDFPMFLPWSMLFVILKVQLELLTVR